ncbi:ferredoxin [Streptomyces ochraceiscleroticus]|uniref:Ferredoxin n=1 Tax=Streptomyces ochraceiscleroticus TaxID=47761 RepID=A0ABW1MIR6_9ACTN|nr:ferredoxin [Streptomyces ochraceiscleroticus]
MAYVIGAACVDTQDRSCVEECPVDCIYEGDRKLYINPTECIDCGACEVACPVEAITVDRKADAVFRDDSRSFFDEVLPGRSEPLGTPGGAGAIGPLGVDTPFVAGWSGA